MFQKHLLVGILFLLAFTTSAQKFIKSSSDKNRKCFKQAAVEAQKNNYKKAIKHCDKILKKEPDNVDVLLRKATYLYSTKKYKESENLFQKAIDLAPDYDGRVYYTIALSQFEQKKLLDASQNFEKFLETGKGGKRQKLKARRLAEQAKFTAKAMANPVPFQPIRLSENVNTKFNEFLPFLTADGSQLIYVTKKGMAQEELYNAQIEGEEIKKGKIFEDFNYPFGEGASCISVDGKTIVITSCDYGNSPGRTSLGGCDLYISYFKQGRWTTPKNLGDKINSVAWESQPCLSADGKSLYYSSKRKMGQGGADLYVSHKSKTGQWGKPINMGGQINTSGDDESPFFHPDGKTFYFRSNGRPGMGDFDIFYTHWQIDSSQWATVQNIGYPINTEGNDGALFVNLEGNKAYFTSDIYSRENDIPFNLDLYSFELYDDARPTPTTYVKGTIRDGITSERLSASIEINNEKGDIRTIEVGNDGEFMATLPAFNNYSFNVSKTGYLLLSDRFELKEMKNALNPFNLEIILWPIPTTKENNVEPVAYNQVIPLKNVLFETGSSTLLTSSDSEIEKLILMMEENPSIHIKIRGHTDNVGSPSDNQSLSELRAKAVFSRLVSSGITPARVRYVGLGETEPIAENDTPEGRKLNRRTEFIVVKM